jgi:hypothetical protein
MPNENETVKKIEKIIKGVPVKVNNNLTIIYASDLVCNKLAQTLVAAGLDFKKPVPELTVLTFDDVAKWMVENKKSGFVGDYACEAQRDHDKELEGK